MPKPVDPAKLLGRRAFLCSAVAAGGAAATLSTAVIAEAAMAPPTPPFDAAGMLARWRGAAARAAAIFERIAAIEPSPPMPEALRVRTDDQARLMAVQEYPWDKDAQDFADSNGFYGRDAADEIRRWKEEKIIYWYRPDPPEAWVVEGRVRAEEILAAFDGWEARCHQRVVASGILEDEAAADVAMYAQSDVEKEALRAPASPEAIALRLEIFAQRWSEDHDGDETAGIDQFDDTESPATYQAVAIALDLLTLTRRGGARCAGDWHPLGDRVRAIVAALPSPISL